MAGRKLEKVEDAVQPHRLISVLAERAVAGSRPGARSDGHRVVLAIEGGGMRGAVSAGMALAVHELGLLPLFDAVYGASAGAISAAWLVSSRPAGLRGWVDPIFARTLIRKRNLLRGRPVVDVERLVETVYVKDFPLDYTSVLNSPVEFHPLATDVVTGAPVDLHAQLVDEVTLRLALRASAALPMLAGGPVTLCGRRYYDAGVAESIPFRQALRDEATHVLVLRSRRAIDGAEAVVPSRSTKLITAIGLRGQGPELREAFLNRSARLADDDRTLAEADTSPAGGPALMSIRPPDSSPPISRLESDGDLLLTAFEAGRESAASTLAAIVPS